MLKISGIIRGNLITGQKKMKKMIVSALSLSLMAVFCLTLASCSLTANNKHYDIRTRDEVRKDVQDIYGTNPYSIF
jgi:hypothetical protein